MGDVGMMGSDDLGGVIGGNTFDVSSSSPGGVFMFIG